MHPAQIINCSAAPGVQSQNPNEEDRNSSSFFLLKFWDELKLIFVGSASNENIYFH